MYLDERPIKCDGCGALKGATNHWWKVRADYYYPLAIIQPIDSEDPAPSMGKLYHYCGASCAIRKISEVMGSPALEQVA